MVKFEDLEVGKEYILLDAKGLTSNFWKRVRVIRKGKSLPINCENKIIGNDIYDFVLFFDKYNHEITMNNHYKEYKDYFFFDLNEDAKGQIANTLNIYREQQLKDIIARCNEEKENLDKMIETKMKLIFEEASLIKKERKRK